VPTKEKVRDPKAVKKSGKVARPDDTTSKEVLAMYRTYTENNKPGNEMAKSEWSYC
jgi:hypothetical protein